MKWIPRIIRMRIHHKENKIGLFTSEIHLHESLNPGEFLDLGNITTEELTRRL